MKDTTFLGNLRTHEVRLILHGDVHEARRELIDPWQPRHQLHVIGAGSFGAAGEYRPESTPRLYNLIEVDRDLRRAQIHTRCQERPDGPWQGWARWPSPDGHAGSVPYYFIDL